MNMNNIIFMAFLYVFNFLVLDSAECQSGLSNIFGDSGYGFIDSTGKIVIKPTFDGVGDFSDGLAWFSDSGKTGYIDTKGRKVFSSPNAFSEFHVGLVPFFKGGKLGFFNKKEEVAFYPRFKNFILGCDLVSWGKPKFSEGLASVLILKCDTCNWRNNIFINKKGVNVFGDRCFASTDNFSDSLAFVRLNNGENGYINHKGEFVINLKQEELSEEFSEGFVVVNDSSYKLRHYINKKGEWLGSSTFDRAEAFSDGLARVEVNGFIGFINTKGELVIKPVYLGNNISHVRNIFGGVDDVSYYGGATLVNKNDPSSKNRWGFTLGPYINSVNLKADPYTDEIFRHEYGHTLQSQLIWSFISNLSCSSKFSRRGIRRYGNQ